MNDDRLRATRSVQIGLLLILAGGAALRFWNLTAGLPYKIGVDEPVIASRAVYMMKTGDFNPHFFDYPGLYLYVQVLVGCVRFIAGAMDGLWHSLDQFGPEHLFLWTRALNAILGTLTILVVYRAGLRWGQWAALLAAALMALWPNHVRESHFALTDVPLTLLTTLALLASLRAHETKRLGWFVAAGASVGLSAATKYTGGVALMMPLIAAATLPSSSRAKCALAAVGASALAFLIGAPYTLLDLTGFLNGFAAMALEFRPRPFSDGAYTYLVHLSVAIGWTGVLVTGLGILWGLVRAFRDRAVTQWTLVLAFPLVFFDIISTKNLIFGRYLLPVVPFLCIVMAAIVTDVSAWVFSWRGPMPVRAAAVAAIVGLVIYQPAQAGISWPRIYGEPTTQDAAYRLIQQFIPPHWGW